MVNRYKRYSENRLPFNRRWQIRKREDGTIMPGPFTIELRKKILKKLLNMQLETNMNLINEDEVEEIKKNLKIPVFNLIMWIL